MSCEPSIKKATSTPASVINNILVSNKAAKLGRISRLNANA